MSVEINARQQKERKGADTDLVETRGLELLQALADRLQRLALVQELAPRVAGRPDAQHVREPEEKEKKYQC